MTTSLPERRRRWEQVHARFLCAHERKEVRRYVRHAGSGGVQVRLQCLGCGACLRTLPTRWMDPARVAALPAWDGELVKRHASAQAAAFAATFGKSGDGAAGSAEGDWWASYDAYLASPEWARRRQLVFIRAGNVCEGCRARKATEVHHLDYARAGDELLWQLVAVCQACHRRAHPDDELPEAS